MSRLLFALLLSAPLSLLAAEPADFAPVAELLAGSTPQTAGLKLDLPSVSEDGSAVAVGIRFDGQLAEGDRLASLHLFATENPKPELITFRLLSDQTLPDFNTRIRLNESQQVIAVAISEQGHSWISAKDVRVTISGCLVRDPDAEVITDMQNPRIALPRRIKAGEPIELRTLISHPMETGLREAADGSLIPQNLIQNLQLTIDEQPALEVQFANGTAANPYVRLMVQGQGRELGFRWQDQQGAEVVEKRQLPL